MRHLVDEGMRVHVGHGGGGVDKFRIKICDNADGHRVVYDNEMDVPEDADPTTVLQGGSIVIHKEK